MYRSKPRECGLNQPLMAAAAGALNDPVDRCAWAAFAAQADYLRLDQVTQMMVHLDRYVDGPRPVDAPQRALYRLPAGLNDATTIVCVLLRSELVPAVRQRETAERTV